MFTTRRAFLASSGLASAGLWIPLGHAQALPPQVRQPAPVHPPESVASAAATLAKSPLPPLIGLAKNAVARLQKAGATFADARLVATTTERIAVRDDRVARLAHEQELGISVRAVVDGAWGFAATWSVEPGAIQQATDRALAHARAVAGVRKALGLAPVAMAEVPAVKGSWVCPHGVDPFEIGAGDKASFLLDIASEIRRVPGVAHADVSVECIREDKLLVNSDGSEIHQVFFRIDPTVRATAIDRRRGRFASREHEAAPLLGGWDYIEELDLKADAPYIAGDALKKLYAPAIEAGNMHVILAPSNLWLTIHESIGHPTELDRVMGLEANMAGTSFLRLSDLGTLQYGSEMVHVVADRTQPGALATAAWDDDGVATTRWDLISGGKLVAWQTTRDQTSWSADHAHHACSYGQGYAGQPFQRMPNVSLQPGSEGYTTEDLINATQNGIYVTGRGSWSIDQQRYNFQFGGQMFWRIKNGRIAGVVRDVAYQANTLEFWRSCDMIGGEGTYRLGGSLGDGKGEPMQPNAVSHGCPPARFTAAVLRTGGDA